MGRYAIGPIAAAHIESFRPNPRTFNSIFLAAVDVIHRAHETFMVDIRARRQESCYRVSATVVALVVSLAVLFELVAIPLLADNWVSWPWRVTVPVWFFVCLLFASMGFFAITQDPMIAVSMIWSGAMAFLSFLFFACWADNVSPSASWSVTQLLRPVWATLFPLLATWLFAAIKSLLTAFHPRVPILYKLGRILAAGAFAAPAVLLLFWLSEFPQMNAKTWWWAMSKLLAAAWISLVSPVLGILLTGIPAEDDDDSDITGTYWPVVRYNVAIAMAATGLFGFYVAIFLTILTGALHSGYSFFWVFSFLYLIPLSMIYNSMSIVLDELDEFSGVCIGICSPKTIAACGSCGCPCCRPPPYWVDGTYQAEGWKRFASYNPHHPRPPAHSATILTLNDHHPLWDPQADLGNPPPDTRVDFPDLESAHYPPHPYSDGDASSGSSSHSFAGVGLHLSL